MALVAQVLAACGLLYSRPPAAIRNPGHPPAAHLAAIPEEMHAGRGAWLRSPCRSLRSLRSERTSAQAQEWGGAEGAGELEPGVPATGSRLPRSGLRPDIDFLLFTGAEGGRGGGTRLES